MRKPSRSIVFIVLAAVLVWAYPRVWHFMRHRGRLTHILEGETYLLTRTIGDACEAYYRQYGRVPTGSNAQVVRALRAHAPRDANPLGRVFLSDTACSNLNPEGEWLDYWKRPFLFKAIETNHILMISAAEDAHFGKYTRCKYLFKEWSDDLGWGYVFTPTNAIAIGYSRDMGSYSVERGLPVRPNQ